MSSIEIRKKRSKAIQTLRDTGMSDAEIEEALGHSIKDESEIIDVEIVSETIRTPTQAELVRQYDLSAPRPISTADSDEQEAESRRISLPARIADSAHLPNPMTAWGLRSGATNGGQCKAHRLNPVDARDIRRLANAASRPHCRARQSAEFTAVQPHTSRQLLAPDWRTLLTVWQPTCYDLAKPPKAKLCS